MDSSESFLRSSAAAYVLPLATFMVLGLFYPDFAESYRQDVLLDPETDTIPAVTPETWTYLGLVGLQVLAATACLCIYRKTYLAEFPLRISLWSIPLGVVGIVLWVALTWPGLEHQLLGWLGMDQTRPSFNPWTIDDVGVRWLFLTIRFTLLALIVPVIEELFLRGWLVRWLEEPDFQTVKLTTLGTTGLLSASFYGVLTHPSEAIAAFVWFGLVTLLVRRTGNLWDAVVVHAITNLLLGLYVIRFQQWHLW